MVRSQATASLPSDASLSGACVVEAPARRAGEAALGEGGDGRLDVSVGRGQQEAEAREGQQPALERDAVRPRDLRRRRAWRRPGRPRSSAAASRRCRASRRRGRRGRSRSRRPRRALRRRSSGARGRRSRSAVKKSLASLMYRPSIANAASRTSPGSGRGGSERRSREPGGGGRQRGRVPERQMPAEDRHAEPVGRPAEAVQDRFGVVLARARPACRRCPAAARPSPGRRRRW